MDMFGVGKDGKRVDGNAPHVWKGMLSETY